MRSAKYDNVGTELAEPIDPERQAASERFRVIWPFLEAGVPLKRIAEEHGKSLRTLRYWVALYRKGDILALVPKPRSDRGKRRMREELKALAEAVWLREPRRPVSSIHRQVSGEAQSRGVPVPSYDQVLAVVRSIDPSLATLSREGTKAHKQKYDLLVRFEASKPNEIWQADHKHLKVWLSDGKGKAKKPWLTARDRVSGSCHVFWYALSGRRRFVPCSTVGVTATETLRTSSPPHFLGTPYSQLDNHPCKRAARHTGSLVRPSRAAPPAGGSVAPTREPIAIPIAATLRLRLRRATDIPA